MTASQPRMKVSLRALSIGGASLAAPIMAFAHHAHDYAPPETAWQGLASGLAHPFLSIPHFVALMVLGLLAAATGAGVRVVGLFCAGSLATALAFATGAAQWPAHDLWVAATLAMGAVALWRYRIHPVPANWAGMVLMVAAGSIHGQIAAESIEAASAVILASYWCGIVAVQAVLGGIVLTAAHRLALRRFDTGVRLRMGGAILSACATLAVLMSGA